MVAVVGVYLVSPALKLYAEDVPSTCPAQYLNEVEVVVQLCH